MLHFPAFASANALVAPVGSYYEKRIYFVYIVAFFLIPWQFGSYLYMQTKKDALLPNIAHKNDDIKNYRIRDF